MIKVALIVCLLCATSAVSKACDETQAKVILSNIQWYTEDYPPYHYQNLQGQLAGIYPELLTLIYQSIGHKVDLTKVAIVSWTRLLYTLENYSNHAAFSMIETPQRKEEFQLVSLPLFSNVTVMVLEENKAILSKKPLEKLKYAVVRADIGEQLLQKHTSAKQIKQTTSPKSMLNMLVNGRIEAIAYNELVAQFYLAKMNATKQKLVTIHTLSDKLQGNFAFHKNTPECVIALFAQTINTLEQKGDIARIMKKYRL